MSEVARRRAEEQRARNARLGIIALVIVAFVVVVVLGVRTIKTNLAQHAVGSVQPSASVNYDPVECAPASLTTTLTTSGATAGQAVTLQLKLVNGSAEHPCYVDVGYNNLRFTVTSGSAHVANLTVCKVGSESKLLLLDRSMTTTYKVTWDGRVTGDACPAAPSDATAAAQQMATAGTYTVSATFADGSANPATATFALK